MTTVKKTIKKPVWKEYWEMNFIDIRNVISIWKTDKKKYFFSRREFWVNFQLSNWSWFTNFYWVWKEAQRERNLDYGTIQVDLENLK